MHNQPDQEPRSPRSMAMGYLTLRLSRNWYTHGPCPLDLVPAFRLIFHPPTAAVATIKNQTKWPVTQGSSSQGTYLLSLTPDSPDRLGGESLNIPQGGSQPWGMTVCCAAQLFRTFQSLENIKGNNQRTASKQFV